MNKKKLSQQGLIGLFTGVIKLTLQPDKLKSGLSKVWSEVKSTATVIAGSVGVIGTVAIQGAEKAQNP